MYENNVIYEVGVYINVTIYIQVYTTLTSRDQVQEIFRTLLIHVGSKDGHFVMVPD